MSNIPNEANRDFVVGSEDFYTDASVEIFNVKTLNSANANGTGSQAQYDSDPDA